MPKVPLVILLAALVQCNLALAQERSLERPKPEASAGAAQDCTTVDQRKRREASLWNTKGIDAQRRREMTKASRYFRRALSIGVEGCAKDSQALSLLSLGAVALERDDLEEAHGLLTRALALYEETGDEDGQGRTLTNLATVALHRGDLAGAEDAYKRALPHLKYPTQHAINLGNLANLLLSQGKIEEAESFFKQQLKFTKNYVLGRARAYHGLCRIAEIRGNLDAVDDFCKRALKLFKQQRDRGRQSTVLLILGQNAMSQNHLQEAETHLNEALSLFEKDRNADSQGGALNLLGIVARLRGNFADAVVLHERAEAMFLKAGSRRGQALAIGYRGAVAFERKDFVQATELLRRALRIYKEIAVENGEVAYLEVMLGHTLNAQNEKTPACQSWKRARDLHRRLGNKKPAAEIERGMIESGCPES